MTITYPIQFALGHICIKNFEILRGFIPFHGIVPPPNHTDKEKTNPMEVVVQIKIWPKSQNFSLIVDTKLLRCLLRNAMGLWQQSPTLLGAFNMAMALCIRFGFIWWKMWVDLSRKNQPSFICPPVMKIIGMIKLNYIVHKHV